MKSRQCQLQYLGGISEPLGGAEILWQRRNRVRRFLKRRSTYLVNWISQIVGKRFNHKGETPEVGVLFKHFEPGDIVCVRPRKEIQSTLDLWNATKGCTFLEEMWSYCDTTHSVLKRVEHFMDERDYLLRKVKGIVILDGVHCQGTIDFGKCDRMCFFFWREEWLQKIDEVH